jgi:hypothetical protein
MQPRSWEVRVGGVEREIGVKQARERLAGYECKNHLAMRADGLREANRGTDFRRREIIKGERHQDNLTPGH